MVEDSKQTVLNVVTRNINVQTENYSEVKPLDRCRKEVQTGAENRVDAFHSSVTVILGKVTLCKLCLAFRSLKKEQQINIEMKVSL